MKQYVVYRILNLKNGRVYIGSSSQPEIRRQEHFGALRANKHINKRLQMEFNDFNEENFVFEILKDGFLTRDAMLLAEYDLILKLKDKCYNVHMDCPVPGHSKKSKSPRRGNKLLYAKPVPEPKRKKNGKKRKIKVRGNHKIKTEYPKLDEIAERKRQREQNINSNKESKHVSKVCLPNL